LLEHGGRLRRAAVEYGIPLADWLDLSTGVNPNGWPVPPIPAETWARLPEDDDGLSEAACAYYGARHALAVAGSQAAIQALPLLYRQLHGPCRVGVAAPGYAEHAQAWGTAGHEVVNIPVGAGLPAIATLDRGQARSYDVLVLIHPNNPTGQTYAPTTLLAWHERLAARGGWRGQPPRSHSFAAPRGGAQPALGRPGGWRGQPPRSHSFAAPRGGTQPALGRPGGWRGQPPRSHSFAAPRGGAQPALGRPGGWLVIDEAFMDATPASSLAAHAHLPGLIVLRSLGKFFGLAGARVGFVLAEAALLERLRDLLGPWAVCGPARHIASLALRDTPWQDAARPKLIAAAARLADVLAHHGLPPSGGSALFQRVETARAGEIHAALARHGILTRLFEHPASLRFGLPGTASEWTRLDAALAKISP